MIRTSSIFGINNKREFLDKCLEIFRYQANSNSVYREFIRLLKVDPARVNSVAAIPFMPIAFFKTREVIADGKTPGIVFRSSGTTGSITSRHLVADPEIYRESFVKGFERAYGPTRNYRILALLPGYLERSDSSLVYMAAELIKRSAHPESGFFLHDQEKLFATLQQLEDRQAPTLLIGVSHALLDFAEKHTMQLKHTIVMETGGMKGRRKELTRQQLHELLGSGLGVSAIHSEYGMTELLSQAYSRGRGLFFCPPWMQIRVRELNDPFTMLPWGRTGGINIIDLANIHSCSFIASDDLGKVYEDGSFEVLGRFDNSDIRGCNLLVN